MYLSNSLFWFLIVERKLRWCAFCYTDWVFLKSEQIFYRELWKLLFFSFSLKPDARQKIYVQTQGESFEILRHSIYLNQVFGTCIFMYLPSLPRKYFAEMGMGFEVLAPLKLSFLPLTSIEAIVQSLSLNFQLIWCF